MNNFEYLAITLLAVLLGFFLLSQLGDQAMDIVNQTVHTLTSIK